jgi:hypothetical protein
VVLQRRLGPSSSIFVRSVFFGQVPHSCRTLLNCPVYHRTKHHSCSMWRCVGFVC